MLEAKTGSVAFLPLTRLQTESLNVKKKKRIIERRVDPPEKKPAIVMDRVIYT